jgi:hypothetical protein
MRLLSDKGYMVGLTVRILRVSGVAGLVGFLLATVVNHLGANQADIQATIIQVDIPNASFPSVTSHQRHDRLDQPGQPAAKADLEKMSAAESTSPDVPEIGEPQHLAPWLGDETAMDSLITAEGAGPATLIAPDVRDTETSRQRD